MQPALISIIIPVYNAEETITLAVASIMKQTYQIFEIILIDDGSTDRSADICDELATKYEEVKTIHVANGGAGKAKNIGAKRAQGDYILFIDADDQVSPQLLETCLATANKHQAELVIYRFNYVTPNGSPAQTYEDNILSSKQILTSKQALYYLLTDQFGPLGRNLFIERKLCQQIKFPQRTHEDGATIYKFMGASKHIIFIPDKLYHYVQYSDSMTHAYHQGDFDNLLLNNKEIQGYIAKKYPELYDTCQTYCLKVGIDGLVNVYNHKKDIAPATYRHYFQAIKDQLTKYRHQGLKVDKKYLLKFYLMRLNLLRLAFLVKKWLR